MGSLPLVCSSDRGLQRLGRAPGRPTKLWTERRPPFRLPESLGASSLLLSAPRACHALMQSQARHRPGAEAPLSSRQSLSGSAGACGWRQGGQRPQRRRAPQPPHANFFGDLFDYDKWAPKSAQAWRLGTPGDRLRGASEAAAGTGASKLGEEDINVLNERLAGARREASASPLAAAEAAAADAAAAAAAEEAEEDRPSFLRSTDEEMAASLAGRIQKVASSLGPAGGSAAAEGEEDEEDEEGRAEGAGLTGPLLRGLIERKWGKTYDIAFVRRDLPLGKTLICLNVMWTHLEQRSFPMSEEEYDEKLSLVSLYLNSWGQAERVESFLRQPARPRKGMPSKPIVGTAISIQLDLEDAVIDEFFSQGGA